MAKYRGKTISKGQIWELENGLRVKITGIRKEKFGKVVSFYFTNKKSDKTGLELKTFYKYYIIEYGGKLVKRKK